MSEQPTRPTDCEEPRVLMRAVVRNPDGTAAMVDVLRREAEILRLAGFSPWWIELHRDDGLIWRANLWSQNAPHLTDYLNAGILLFDDEPGSLCWEGSSRC